MNKNKNPNNCMKHGSKAYVVLCYAKMKSGMKHEWFTRDDYRDFQLNRREHLIDLDRTMKTLEKNEFIESRIVNAICLYKITDWGKYALVALGETHRRKHLNAKASNMRANELKSRTGAKKDGWDYDSLD
jgi:hypothetical protein